LDINARAVPAAARKIEMNAPIPRSPIGLKVEGANHPRAGGGIAGFDDVQRFVIR
jgi:hypothetical protein